jgi:hypothetical protein
VESLSALREARRMAGVNGMVCVTGSHYLVGELLAEVKKNKIKK